MNNSTIFDHRDFNYIANVINANVSNNMIKNSLIQKNIDGIIDIVEKEANNKKKTRIADLRANLIENKIDSYFIKSSHDFEEAILDFLNIESENNILIELKEELLENDVYSFLDKSNLSYTITHPNLYGINDFNLNKGIKALNESYFEEKPLDSFFKKLKEKSFNSTTGITTADFVTSDTGTAVIFDRFGHRALLATAPEKHLIVVDLFKSMRFYNILSLLDELKRLNGNYLDTNIHFISNPSRTGDIERIIVYGAHGPLSLGVIVVNKETSSFDKDYFSLYPYSLMLEQIFPVFKQIANRLYFTSINPITITNGLDRFNANNAWLLAQVILKVITSSDLVFPESIIKAFTKVIELALKAGEISTIREGQIKTVSEDLFSKLKLKRND